MKRKGARLGQHFLTGLWAARALARAVSVRENETILEIGPGKGALTEELLETGAQVIAIEKDPPLVETLQEKFGDQITSGRLHLVEADIRDIDVEKLGLKNEQYVVAANIPYYITGEIIRQFLTAPIQPRAMALLVQKEVAERILARDKKESILSLSVKAYGNPRIEAKVARGNFSPPPSVDSAILVIENISRDFFKSIDEETFFKVVRAGFSSKRKKLLGNLTKVFGEKVRAALVHSGIEEQMRAEDLQPLQWQKLTANLTH